MANSVRNLIGPLFSGSFWRGKTASWEARRFDRRYGTDTLRRVAVADMAGVAPALAKHAVHYEASAIPKFRRGMRVVERVLGPALATYEFLDVGSGKGLVVMLASRYPFTQIHGVELAVQLHEVALSNLDRFRVQEPRAARVTLRNANVLETNLPTDNLVVYLYNPFDAELMAQFVDRICRSSTKRDVIVVYVNPLHQHVFFEHGFILLADEGTLSVLRRRFEPDANRA